MFIQNVPNFYFVFPGNKKMFMIFTEVCVLKNVDEIEQNIANSEMFMNGKIS